MVFNRITQVRSLSPCLLQSMQITEYMIYNVFDHCRDYIHIFMLYMRI